MKTKLNLLLKSCVVLFLLCTSCKNQHPQLLLPVFGPKEVAANGDTLYHKIGPFKFRNQFNEDVSNSTTAGKIYVADFFFATCQSICPVMSTHMKDVQKKYEGDKDILILSHSVNPLHDTVEVLFNYAATYGAIKNKWHFLTGNKKEIYDLAMRSYLVNALEDDGSEEGFLHSELFLLIDREGRLRGTYDGTDKVAVEKLISDIQILKHEDPKKPALN